MDAIAKLDFIDDNLGLDTIEMGATIGVAMEAGLCHSVVLLHAASASSQRVLVGAGGPQRSTTGAYGWYGPGATAACMAQRFMWTYSGMWTTHHHFDHTRDLVTLAANAGYYWRKQLAVYAPRYTLDIVTSGLLDGKMYTNFFEYPSKEKPTLMLEAIEPYDRRTIAGYDVLAVPVKHSVPAVGYQIPLRMAKACFTPAIPQWEYLTAGSTFLRNCLLLKLPAPISMKTGSRRLVISVPGF
jgi:hypothetical protein